MGYESLLFVATPSDLERAFVGWKPAIFPPRIVEGVNPFTKAKMTVTVDTMEYGDEDEVDASVPWEKLTSLDGPSLDQAVSSPMLHRLAKALGLGKESLRKALSEPPGCEVAVYTLDAAFVARMAGDDVRAALVGLGASDGEAQETAEGLAAVARAATERRAGVYLVEEI
jgi:hypothetical protein